jgi:hypothetical protein
VSIDVLRRSEQRRFWIGPKEREPAVIPPPAPRGRR